MSTISFEFICLSFENRPFSWQWNSSGSKWPNHTIGSFSVKPVYRMLICISENRRSSWIFMNDSVVGNGWCICALPNFHICQKLYHQSDLTVKINHCYALSVDEIMLAVPFPLSFFELLSHWQFMASSLDWWSHFSELDILIFWIIW